MKHLLLLALGSVFFTHSYSQSVTTGKIDSLKESWGFYTTYIGEIKGGKPNGLGMAVYSSGTALRYVGNFVNGKYEGRGVLLFKDATFLTGEWKGGKLNGQGSDFNINKTLYIGGFANGEKSGKGTYLFLDNGLFQGDFKADKYNGRGIYISKNANIICDNVYYEDKKSGQGFQYELDNKKLFEGIWKDGEWANSSTANYSTFLKNSNFYGEKTDGHYLMGNINSSSKLLDDTAFYYDLKDRKRYFGFYRKGYLQNGIIIRDDSSRFFGRLNTEGAIGKCWFLKLGKYYDEGNYVKDYLNGDDNLSINIDKKTVYFGQTTGKAEFTGQAWFANNSNSLFKGRYLNGDFVEGWKINKSGYCLKGTWNNDTIATISALYNDNGELVNLNPKTFSEALTITGKAYLTGFVGLEKNAFDRPLLDFLYNIDRSSVSFPGGAMYDLVCDDYVGKTFHVSVYKETYDYAEAKLKYDYLCNQLKTASVSIKKGKPSIKLTGEVKPADDSNDLIISQFVLPATARGYSEYAVSVVMRKDIFDEYVVMLVCGDKYSVQDWFPEL